MNSAQFYNGILAELRKTAEAPKKKSIFANPALWGGLAAAGLGGYGLYKAYGHQTPNTPTSIPRSPHVHPIQTNEGMEEAPTPNLIGRASNWTGGAALPAFAVPGGSGLGMGLAGASSILDTWDPNQGYGAGSKLFRTGVFGGETALNTSLGRNLITKGIGAVSPSASKAVAPVLEGVADQMYRFSGTKAVGRLPLGPLRMLGPVGTAYTAGQLGQEMIEGAGNNSANHATQIGQVSQLLPNLKAEFKSPNLDDQGDAYNISRNLFSTPKGIEYQKYLTNPDLNARAGYNPLPVSLNPSTWAKWFNNKQDFSGINTGLEDVRKRYIKEVLRRGDVSDMMRDMTPPPLTVGENRPTF